MARYFQTWTEKYIFLCFILWFPCTPLSSHPLHFSIPWLQIFHMIFKSHGCPNTLQPNQVSGLEFKSLHEFCWVHGHTGVAVASHNTTGLSQRMEGVCCVCSRYKNHIQQHRFFTMSIVRENNTGTQRSHGFQIKISHLWPGFALKLKKNQWLKFNKKGEKKWH